MVSIRRKARKGPELDAHALPDDQKKPIKPRAAIAWFLSDMAETSGYAVATWTDGKTLSLYAEHRPMLTAPDPWYYAGIVALEACKIIDLFDKPEADELMREVLRQMDNVVGRFNNDCSELAVLLMGRLGMGSLILHRKVPDNLLAKIMLILLGSPTAAAPNMPDENAHKQLKAALKTGAPVWWKMFRRHYKLKMPGMVEEQPKLTDSILTEKKKTTLGNAATQKEASSLRNILASAFRDDDEFGIPLKEAVADAPDNAPQEMGRLALDEKRAISPTLH